MITENVGKLLVNTQDELKLLKGELESLQNPFNMGAPEEYKQMINKIKNQLSRFEEKIGNQVDALVSNEMNNYDSTLNKLPLISKPEPIWKEPGSNKNGPKFPHMSYSAEKEKRTESRVDPRFLFMQKLANNPTSNVTKKMLQDKFTLPFAPEPQMKMKPYSTLKPLQKNQVQGKISKPVGILPREIRNNPFAVAPLTENDVKQGMMSLIARGLVPKEVDLTPAFEQGAPTLSMQKVRLHTHKEQFIKGEVSSVPAYLSTVKFDVKALESPPPAQNNMQSRSLTEPKSTYGRASHPAVTEYSNSAKKEYQFDKTNAKDYEEVMDAYSLHQFIIRKGKTLIETPEFQSYKRTFFGFWDPIMVLVTALEKILTDFDIKVAYIDGKKLAQLAEVCFGKPTLVELLDCIVNQDDINKVIKIPQNMFKGANGKVLAATKIQSFWRMHKARKTFRRVKVLIEKVKVLQNGIRLYLQHRKTLDTIKNKKEQYYDRYREMAEKFKEDWPQTKLKRRVEIHIQSISGDELQRLSMEKFLQKQNAQIARLFALKDPLVDIIYVAPFDMPPEVLSYYAKVFELGGLGGQQGRYTIVWPENHHNFPGHFPTTRLLMYSPRVIKRIKQLIHGKTAYIVPSMPSSDDIELAVMLNAPLFSGDPQKNALYSTKSGAKAIFQASELPIPPGSFNIYDEKEFILTLTKLIAYNFHINTWIFKIDDEFSGRGHATFSIDQVRSLVELRNRKVPVTEDLILKIHEIVSSILPLKIKIVMPHLYRNYNEYIMKFVQKGGVIEAAPNCMPSQVSSCSIGFMVDPVGDVEVLGSYDKFFSTEYVACGYFFPQKSIPNLNLQALCETVGKSMYAQGVFGYATLDIISFPDPAAPKQTAKTDKPANRIFWAVDLNCYMTTNIASTLFFDFLMKGNMDPVSGLYHIPKPMIEESETRSHINKGIEDGEDSQEKRCFMYCPFVYHPGLATIQYKTFFHMCRMKGISYDLESKTGTTFVLLDSLQTGIMGLLTTGRYRRNVVKYMSEALSFIASQTGAADSKLSSASGDIRPDTMYLNEVASRVRLINRVFEKKHRKIN